MSFAGTFNEWLVKRALELQEQGFTPTSSTTGTTGTTTGGIPTYGGTQSTGPTGDSGDDESWDDANKLDFERSVAMVIDSLGIGGVVPIGEVRWAVEQWAESYRAANGRWPTIAQVVGAGDLRDRLSAQTLRTAPDFPSTFYMDGQLWQRGSGLWPVPVAQSESDRMLAAMGLPGLRHVTTEQLAAEGIPTLTAAQLSDMLARRDTGVGGGGGGGRGLVLDLDAIEERIRNSWRSQLLEEPENARDLAKKFEREAQAMWRAGGQKDLDTWTALEMRKTDRYKTLYARKAEGVSEQEWLSQYMGAAAQTGLPTDMMLQQTVRGASTGAAPASFAESLRDDRDVQSLGTGNLSRNFANMMSQLGPLMSGKVQ